MKGKDIIMKVRVVFRLRCENSRVRSREGYLSLQRKLKKYRLKETFLDDPIYRIDQDIEAYDEMICFCEKNQKSISFIVKNIRMGKMIIMSVNSVIQSGDWIIHFLCCPKDILRVMKMNAEWRGWKEQESLCCCLSWLRN